MTVGFNYSFENRISQNAQILLESSLRGADCMHNWPISVGHEVKVTNTSPPFPPAGVAGYSSAVRKEVDSDPQFAWRLGIPGPPCACPCAAAAAGRSRNTHPGMSPVLPLGGAGLDHSN